jgi:carbamoylphosphate synthase large subunit
MKILFIGARLFDDVALYTKNNAIESILTESNPKSANLKLADKYYLVSRGMDEPTEIAIKEDVDGVVPLIGIDEPLIEVAIMKEKLENDYGIPVAASGINPASICADKFKTKEFFVKNDIRTPEYIKLSKNNYEDISSKIKSNRTSYVLKQAQGQGGSGIKIVSSMMEVEDYFIDFETAFAEKYLEGFEVSIEILRWNGNSVPLVPVYKGKTTPEGLHPLKKIKKAPLEIEGIDNQKNNLKIQEIAVKIAETMQLEGTADIDIIFDKETKKNNVIEVNARPSGTRYITKSATGINIMHELINMASKCWKPLKLKSRIKNYAAIEIPVGSYQTNKNNYKFREFSDENSWIIHGPNNHERITIRDKTIANAIKKAQELKILE